jgi:hypothetical protein
MVNFKEEYRRMDIVEVMCSGDYGGKSKKARNAIHNIFKA